MKKLSIICFVTLLSLSATSQDATKWAKHEISFTSSKYYENPIYDVKDFRITFTSPTGQEKVVNGFWDGSRDWKVRFLPDAVGVWNWKTECTDKENSGLHNQTGTFNCNPNTKDELIFQKGAIKHIPGKYHFSHNDGTPFFWLACTAWNGALKATQNDWDFYLNQRKKNNYNVIQLVTTEWRGCDKSADGYTAIEGTGHIQIHPEFFKRIDDRIDEANAKGIVVSPVALWALPRGKGRHLSPGYTLPLEEAVLLAKYIVARYQGNHVVWTLGGDGKYYDDQELKWKKIGQEVFNNISHAPATLHPHGRSWIGELFVQEDWYNLMGYQSSHGTNANVVDWINKGPITKMWDKLKPMPYINMEPAYEQIRFVITDKDVRNASYWSLFATPVAGVTYGAAGIWPWLEEGEKILNHNDKGGVLGWKKSIEFPGSLQMGYLAEFFQKFDWWDLYPANELLVTQPGEDTYNHWISILKSTDHKTILAYIPEEAVIKIYNPDNCEYNAQWFDPVLNTYEQAEIIRENNQLIGKHNFSNDMILIFTKK